MADISVHVVALRQVYPANQAERIPHSQSAHPFETLYFHGRASLVQQFDGLARQTLSGNKTLTAFYSVFDGVFRIGNIVEQFQLILVKGKDFGRFFFVLIGNVNRLEQRGKVSVAVAGQPVFAEGACPDDGQLAALDIWGK